MKRWVVDNQSNCSGNIENLLDYREVARGEHPTMAPYCYAFMFSDSGLQRAPELPATTLAESCYQQMFSDCTNLTNAPELPATTLAENCYFLMFSDCISLLRSPALPATTLAKKCYFSMFFGCTNLATLPKIPATQLPLDSCYAMFSYCSNIKLSTTQTEEYQTAYRIPISGTGTDYGAFTSMFLHTGGTFTGSDWGVRPNTTYYTSNTLV